MQTPNNNTFESFIVGASNRQAYAAALAVAQQSDQASNPLFIYGPPGCGKTHLLDAIANRQKEMNPSTRYKYTTGKQFFTQFIRAVQKGESLEAFRQKYEDTDILLVDDLEGLQRTEKGLEEFFQIFGNRLRDGRQVVLTSALAPRLLTGFAERYRSRMGWGLIAPIEPPNLLIRLKILEHLAQQQELTIESDALEYIALNLSQDVRQLENAINELRFDAAQWNTSSITLKKARETLDTKTPAKNK